MFEFYHIDTYMKNTIFLRRLVPNQIAEYAEHLLKLEEQDRFLRFASNITDKQIMDFAQQTNFYKDCVIAAFNKDLDIVGTVHVYTDFSKEGVKVAEIAISVQKEYRGQKLAQKLIKRALNWCQNNNIKRIEAHWLNQNKAVNKLANTFGGNISVVSDERDAYLEIEKPNLLTMWEGLFTESIGWVTYSFNLNKNTMAKIPFSVW